MNTIIMECHNQSRSAIARTILTVAKDPQYISQYIKDLVIGDFRTLTECILIIEETLYRLQAFVVDLEYMLPSMLDGGDEDEARRLVDVEFAYNFEERLFGEMDLRMIDESLLSLNALIEESLTLRVVKTALPFFQSYLKFLYHLTLLTNSEID